MASHFSVLSCFQILQWPVWKWTQLKDSFKFSRQQKLLFLWLSLAVCLCWLTGLWASELLYLVSTPIRYNLHMYSVYPCWDYLCDLDTDGLFGGEPARRLQNIKATWSLIVLFPQIRQKLPAISLASWKNNWNIKCSQQQDLVLPRGVGFHWEVHYIQQPWMSSDLTWLIPLSQ